MDTDGSGISTERQRRRGLKRGYPGMLPSHRPRSLLLCSYSQGLPSAAVSRAEAVSGPTPVAARRAGLAFFGRDRGSAPRVGSNRMLSWRLAPSMAQPTGIPARSVASDHLNPSLARSQGFFPVPSQRRALCVDSRRPKRR